MPTKRITAGLVGRKVLLMGPGCPPKGCEAFIKAICPCGRCAVIASCCGEWPDRMVLISRLIVMKVMT